MRPLSDEAMIYHHWSSAVRNGGSFITGSNRGQQNKILWVKLSNVNKLDNQKKKSRARKLKFLTLNFEVACVDQEDNEACCNQKCLFGISGIVNLGTHSQPKSLCTHIYTNR